MAFKMKGSSYKTGGHKTKMERHMSAGHYDNMSPKAKNNAQRTINALRGHMESQGDYSWKEGYNF